MLLTEQKPITEILESLAEEKHIFLLVCNGCPEACETGAEKQRKEIEEKLTKAGKNVIGHARIDFLCNKVLVAMRLSKFIPQLKEADCLLVLSCGIGVQAASALLEKPVHPALNTISVGGFQGLWPAEERCEQCGDCVLDLTSGICPISLCTKGLLNGPCGGAKEGKCEIDKEKDCGWQLIYERLKSLGKLDNLKKIRSPRNYQKMLPSSQLRKTPFYNIEGDASAQSLAT